jgi:hypothetical protein
MYVFQISAGQLQASMTEPVAEYGLGETQFQRAIALLDQVEQSLRLPWWQQISYRLYTILIIALGVSCVSCILIAFSWTKIPAERSFVLFVSSYALGILAILGALVSIPLNLPLLIKVHRQKLRLRELGMTDAWIGFLGTESRRERWLTNARNVACVLGIVLILVSIPASLTSQDAFYVIFMGGAGLVLVVFYLLQEGKIWLDIVSSRFNEISQLKADMAKLNKQEAGRVAVPTALIEKFAQVQTGQILFGRANAMAEFKSAGELFSVLTSRKVLDQKAKLNIESRLKVEDAIEELMQGPRSTKSKTDKTTEQLSCPVDGTDLEILYAVDEKEHRLRLIELRQGALRGQHA